QDFKTRSRWSLAPPVALAPQSQPGSAVAAQPLPSTTNATKDMPALSHLTITSAGGTAFIVGGDVAKVDDAKSIVKAVVDRCGEIDILVNCAGILEYARFGDID